MLNNNLSDLIKKVPDSLKQKFILISGSILFIGLIYLMILYNSSLKKQRIEAVESFLSNNQTILLKDYTQQSKVSIFRVRICSSE